MPTTPYKDILIAVHGIGAQMRNATVRSVATRLAASPTLPNGPLPPPVATQPLGYFHREMQGVTSVCPLDEATYLAGRLSSIGFSEVFWADVPQEVVREGRTLEETKAWARTVVARARTHCLRAHAVDRSIIPPDFDLASEVLEEIIETIHVLENLTVLSAKAGLASFDLRKILDEYVNDVQLVTEFSVYRRDILGRFHQAMEDICTVHCKDQAHPARLHIVAHSEGTVVSFLGLLHAMSATKIIPADPINKTLPKEIPDHGLPEWLGHVHGYMTIGSPIDKHLLLWPALWRDLKAHRANQLFGRRGKKIQWRNYYDFGDPVGFQLDTARTWLARPNRAVTGFEFEKANDIGFARYLLPGKAHNDYWDDPDVFDHFIKDVVLSQSDAEVPTTRKHIYVLSPTLPYVVSGVVLILGVYILYKTVSNFSFPTLDPLKAFTLYNEVGLTRTSAVSGGELFQHVLAISLLLAGTSLLARIPRLAGTITTKKRLPALPAGTPVGSAPAARPAPISTLTWRWRFWAFAAFAAGGGAYVFGVGEESRNSIGAMFQGFGAHAPTWGILASALLVGAVSWILVTWEARRPEDRKERWVRRGMRPLIASGAIVVLAIVTTQLLPAWSAATPTPAQEAVLKTVPLGLKKNGGPKTGVDLVQEARLTEGDLVQLFARSPEALRAKLPAVAPLLVEKPPVWPVLLATAAFLYLWWLAALIFDLGFVWQRYVRQALYLTRMGNWVTPGYWDSKHGGGGESVYGAGNGNDGGGSAAPKVR